jgi:hypothetical protein
LAVDATTKKKHFLEREQVMKMLGGTVWFSISLHRAEQQSVGGEEKKKVEERVKSQIYYLTRPCQCHDAVFLLKSLCHS